MERYPLSHGTEDRVNHSGGFLKRFSAFVVILTALLFVSPLWFGLSHRILAQRPGTDAPGQILPEKDPEFLKLLDKLAARAELYRKNTLGFTCREVVLVTTYNVQTTAYRKSESTTYDYLFEQKRHGKLREFRERLVLKGDGTFKRRRAEFDPPLPPAYRWTSIFSRKNRGRFHFRPAGQVVRAYRLLNIINFVGTSPNPGGTEISGWSGQMAIDEKTLNLWSITAEPSGQNVRLEVEIRKYNKAFAIAGIPLASRPHGWELSVTFGLDERGLSYPTEQKLSETSLSRGQRMNVKYKTTFRYERYRFFGVGVESEVTATDPPPDQEP